jgi:hypothetical protein
MYLRRRSEGGEEASAVVASSRDDDNVEAMSESLELYQETSSGDDDDDVEAMLESSEPYQGPTHACQEMGERPLFIPCSSYVWDKKQRRN